MPLDSDIKGFFAFCALISVIVAVGAVWIAAMVLVSPSTALQCIVTACMAACLAVGFLWGVGEGSVRRGIKWMMEN